MNLNFLPILEFPQKYDPKYVEEKWYDWWLSQQFFKPCLVRDLEINDKEIFSMVLPPPNVTGTLHLGHALTNSIQDALVRWNRMHGKSVVWVPGSDHAGIATQVVVEKRVWKDKKQTRHDVGREKFIEEVWKWKNQKGNIISDQMKRLGSSLDWSRECFTMDKRLSDAVNEAFVRLHDEGLIYRSNKLVNWSCSLQSAISNIEVENVEIEGKQKFIVPGYEKPVNFGVMTLFKYPVENSDESITVATTRPETMLGDVAVAVNPNDSRYLHLHNHHVIHPIDNRRLPIITDEFVDKEFGTGAVKITPGHDYNDFDIGRKHDLPALTIIDINGRMTNTTEEFDQKRRFDVRWMVVKKLKDLGLFIEERSHAMTLPMCSRSKDIIEPLLKEQWYINCIDMNKKAIQSLQNGELKIVPKNYEKHLIQWLTNTEDWCISRQLWWGHQIPAYRLISPKQSCDLWISGRNEMDAKQKAANKLDISVDYVEVERDEDVLDTWFSSAIFPFSVHGWPQQNDTLSRYYPNSLLETGNDILYMWVARMVILGQKLTGQLPFNQVLLHGILKDAYGRKMSKSLGNVIDPMDVIQGVSLQQLIEKLKDSNLDEKEINKAEQGNKKEFPTGIPECGADALRFTLCSHDFKAGEVSIDRTLFKSNRHFCNKIWQGFRYILSNFGDDFIPSSDFQITDSESLINKWIISQLSNLVLTCDKNFKSYDLHQVALSLHQFWVSQFCDVYLECTKPVFLHGSPDQKQEFREVLYLCIETFLRCLSPFMPFITEELYQRLPDKADKSISICVAPYPTVSRYNYRNITIENKIKEVQTIVSNVLRMKLDYKLKVPKPG
ncbi:hypothetical protein LOTGIDRAFT_118105 [Lottia gigantea]|uniref:Valine--tRNA ligase, mitochondrial n=1 Tax=Lottia gigantea TaxID=225164 RepID=V4BZG6_LOTGI|nr:hypothetical protein LOTGIDRAFT_118105 [Lottia gigantea]ESO94544.1 hypothetical protein LOTGIDRAFT_118105 [Lottia gigantea]